MGIAAMTHSSAAHLSSNKADGSSQDNQQEDAQALAQALLDDGPNPTFDEAQAVAQIAQHTRALLDTIGEDPHREGLLKTPERVAKAQVFLTEGYRCDPHELLRSALFKEDYRDVVLVRDIEFFSMCEHHMLPFFGRVHVAYQPNGHIVGLSKIPRLVNAFARRLQVQERLTMQICDAINEVLAPTGVAVAIEASHLCMVMRGVQKQRSMTLTVSTSGVFEEPARRAEFLQSFKS